MKQYIFEGRIPTPALRLLQEWVKTECLGKVQWCWHNYAKDDPRYEVFNVTGEWAFLFDEDKDFLMFCLKDWPNFLKNYWMSPHAAQGRHESW